MSWMLKCLAEYISPIISIWSAIILNTFKYIFVQESRELDVNGRHVYVFLSKVHNFSSVPPPPSGIIRVSEYSQSLAITSNGREGSTGDNSI